MRQKDKTKSQVKLTTLSSMQKLKIASEKGL